ncbi:MAG TPA: choice-of-anchor Q domain-containing protein [Rhodanobacteraceae bacterium]|nr:choice-of-anchor Q domain-containing protein [Rhodanobacteraceae bacterium]
MREIIENPMKAQSGDTVDLDQLPTLCVMANSVITLGSEIEVHQDNLTLQGPTEGTVTISGAGLSRVFHHTGAGTLALNALTVSDGHYHPAAGPAYGGCIDSDSGDVVLSHVVVRNCVAISDGNWTKGGGVHARNVSLIASSVSGNQAGNSGTSTMGGGVYALQTILSWYSAISGNEAPGGFGGGLAARNGTTLIASTIEGNHAGKGGGFYAGDAAVGVFDSTISGNSASDFASALEGRNSIVIANSTIAFNHQDSSDTAGAIVLGNGNNPNSTLTLQSSIVADNTATAANTAADIFIYPGAGSLAGADNLVISSNVSDPAVITLTSDPKLAPLAFNGGPTRTHILLPGSPALGKGNIDGLPAPWNTTDQRGVGYPRTSGPAATIDIGAVQFDSIFADGLDSFLF